MGAQSAWVEPFLAALAENSNVSEVCRTLGIARQTVYDRKLADPEFGRRFTAALEVTGEMLEATAFSRAIDGWEEPVYFQGQHCGDVRKYDNGMLMRLLAARNPKYQQRTGVDLSGKLDVSSMSDAELNAEIIRLQKLLAISPDAADSDTTDIA